MFEQLRLKQAEYEKEKAILLQKVEQLESHHKDSESRHSAQLSMYETMINSLKNHDSTSSTLAASLQASEKKSLDSEIQELKDHKKRLQEELELQDRVQQRALNDKDSFIKEMQLQVERMMIEKSQMLLQWDSEKKELQNKITMINNEKEQIEVKSQLKSQSKYGELQMDLEKMKLEHQREMERVKNSYDQNLKEIKYLHEQEKCNLENRVQRSTNELQSLIHLVKHKDQEPQFTKQQLEQQLQMLHMEVEALHQQYENLKNEKEVAEAKATKLAKQLDKLKNAPKPVKIDLVNREPSENDQRVLKNLREEVNMLQSENDKMSDQIKKLRQQILDLQDYTEKIESNEKKLKQMLRDRGSSDQDQVLEIRKQLNMEKRKNMELQDAIGTMKERLDRDENKHINEMLEKDDKIIKLTRELRENEKKLLDIHQVFDSNRVTQRNKNSHETSQTHRNMSYSPLSHMPQHNHYPSQNFAFPAQMSQISPRGSSQNSCVPLQINDNQNMKQITQLELTLLKQCQRMANSAVRMECAICYIAYDTADFYDHIIQDHPAHSKNQSSIIIGNQLLSSQQQFSTNQNKNPVRRPYAEDSAVQQQSTSPRVVIPKFAQNSRSFTCLLNEIEEEEKNTSSSQLTTVPSKNLESERYSKKSPIQNNEQKSRNISTHQAHNSTVLFGTAGNTLGSVLRAQNVTKKSSKNKLNSTGTGITMVQTACRTEIQNLKKQNKKLNNKLQEQEGKIKDVSRECSFIKKQQSIDKGVKREKSTHLTNEIKNLLEQLVSYQDNNPKTHQTKGQDGMSGAFTSRHYSNLPMSTDSLVELRSSATSSAQGKQKQMKNMKKSKSPINLPMKSSNHNSNKENVHEKVVTNPTRKVVPTLNLNKKSENHESASSLAAESQSVTERRRYHDINKSELICSNSPRRYQNYFELLQSLGSNNLGATGATTNTGGYQQQTLQTHVNNRYSPTHQNEISQQTTTQNLSSMNNNMPLVYHTKHHTLNSSNNNLVLYDSTNTDMFKSKNFKFNPTQPTQHNSKPNRNPDGRKLDFDSDSTGNMHLSQEEDDVECYEQEGTDKEYIGGYFNATSSVDEDPFITGRFCDNNAKQFLFKQQNSKNATVKGHKLINH